MKKHFVVFLSPGTFVHEESTKEIDSWDVEQAKKMARKIIERHNATPFGFYFITRTRGDNDLDSKISDESPMYYLGGKVETLEEVKARAIKDDSILIGNMECNRWDRIITNTNSWKITQPLRKGDVILDWDAPKKVVAAGSK